MTSQSGAGTGNGGRTVADALASGDRNGSGTQTGVDSFLNSGTRTAASH